MQKQNRQIAHGFRIVADQSALTRLGFEVNFGYKMLIRHRQVAYRASARTCNIATRTCLFQDFGSGNRCGFLVPIMFSTVFNYFFEGTGKNKITSRKQRELNEIFTPKESVDHYSHHGINIIVASNYWLTAGICSRSTEPLMISKS
jgi:hypothetical protein